MLVTGQLRLIAETHWSERRHLKMERLEEPAGVAVQEAQAA